MRTKFLVIALLLSGINAQRSTFAQGTAFTYQGRLNDGVNPANGVYDFQFAVYDAGANGNQIGGLLTNSATIVSNGLFTVTLDFGPGIFTGADRFLETAVRTNGSDAFTALAPRRQFTPSPYAIFAGGANAAGLTGTIPPTSIGNGTITSSQLASSIGLWTQAGANIFYSGGFVGIGTNNPNKPLTIQASGANSEWIQLIPNNGSRWHVNNRSNGLNFAETTIADYRLFLQAGGNVGIGTSSPLAKLQVAGTAIAGSAANRIAPGVLDSSIGGGGTSGANYISGSDSFIGAGSVNNIDANALFSFIGAGNLNTNSGFAAFIGSGWANLIQTNATFSLVGGGEGNNIQADHAFIGGGFYNVIQGSAPDSLIAGGFHNAILSGPQGAIGGGANNTNGAFCATIPGGSKNMAMGSYSFAAGYQAKAQHDGAFVWADSQGIPLTSTAANQFLIRALGGVGIGTASPTAPLHVVGDAAPLPTGDAGVVQGVQTSGSYLGAGIYGLSLVPGGNGVIGVADVSTNDGSFPVGVVGTTAGTNGCGIQAVAGAGTGPTRAVYAKAYSPAGYAGYFEGRGYFSANVGIGTAAPAAPLHVVGSNPFPHLAVAAAANAPYGAFLSIDATATTGGQNYLIFSTGAAAGEGQGKLVFQNHSQSVQIMCLTTNGNVGIGTLFPTNKLHVLGGATFSSGTTGANQNVVWIPGNASWSFTSDRDTKDRVEPVDTQAVLEKVSRLPIAQWNYIGYEQRHIGPMAQDFHEQFPLNANDKALNDADLHGVALAAIQGLNDKLNSENALLRAESKRREAENAQLQRRLDKLEQMFDRLVSGGE